MSVYNNKEIVKQFFDEILINQKVQTLEKFASTRIAIHSPYYNEVLTGYEHQTHMLKTMWEAYTHQKITVEDILEDGDRVAVRWTLRGVHTQEFMHIPPSGKPISLRIMTFYRLRRGKIIEVWEIDTGVWSETD